MESFSFTLKRYHVKLHVKSRFTCLVSDRAKEKTVGLFQKRIGTIFLKENSEAEEFIEKMQILSEKADGEIKAEIEKQIKIAKYGLQGEKAIAFELRNSGIDMYVLHDIYLEAGDLSAQIDYLLVTRKHIYVIECKNLIGNIEIDNAGNFIRTYELSGKKIKEGIYSPLTQNQRHLQVIKELRLNTKTNILTRAIFEKNFENNYKSLIVLANPKTCLNAKYAKKEVKEKIIRVDQLIAKVKEMDNTSGNVSSSTEEMEEIAEVFLNANVKAHSDYAKKYEELILELENHSVNSEGDLSKDANTSTEEKVLDIEGLTKALKKFRLECSRAEGLKPYYIFNDAQMQDLITKRPKTEKELLQVSGFGKVKVEKYGGPILEIFRKYLI